MIFSLVLTLCALPAAAEERSALRQLGADSGHGVEAIEKSLQKAREIAAAPKELFAVTEKNGRKLLEIRSEQMGNLHLFSATVDKGTGEKGLYSAAMTGTFVWYFRLVDKTRIQFIRKNMAQRAEPGSPEAKAISESYQDSLIGTVPMISSDSVKDTYLIDARSLFLLDFVQMGEWIKNSYGKPVKLSDKDSHLADLKSFPKNLEASAQLQFEGAGDVPSTLPDSRLISVTMHYSLSALASSPGFTPRAADPRVGYFQTSFQDLTNKDLKDKFSPSVNLINRWHLEKADPAAPVSDVKAPIVYWLDATIPHEYRPYVRAGILAWNAAFEATGLRNAIVVKEVDNDMPTEERNAFDPANASYNVVRWFMGDQSGMAQAPSRVNPMTGEIFNANIRIGDQLTRLTRMLTAVAVPQTPAAYHEHDRNCSHWQALQASAAALALAEAQAPLTEQDKKRFVGELLTWITAHETGHTLGLRHNFEGGALHPLGEAGKDGLVSSSLMHYLPPNLASAGQKQGVYYQNQVGPYDRWAVEYGYKQAAGGDELHAVAARSARDPRLKYCTDEDVGTSPDCQRFLLGRDVTSFARQRTGLADTLFQRLEKTEPSGADGYTRLRDSYLAGLGVYNSAAAAVLPAIGGVRTRRVNPGDGPAPFEAVSADEQRAALAFLDEKIFSAAPFAVSPKLLQSMAGDRLERSVSAPFPLAQSVLQTQKNSLDHIYNPATLGRLSDGTLFGQRAITPGEVMTTVRRSIWKEVESSKPSEIGLIRRNLQREHLRQITALLESPATPGDARAQARRDLDAIAASTRRALTTGALDDVSATHLEDMNRLAEEALHGKNYRITPSGV